MKGLPGKLGASRKRAIFGIVAGCVVALALIWVKSNLYDPFAEEFDEISVFVTEDADFVVFSPDFPTLVKGLEDRPFISQLDRSKNFRRFLASDLVKSTDIVPRLREAYSSLRDIDAELPFDLQALGDLSGSGVIVSGFKPEMQGGEFTFVAAFQPESDLALTAARALINPTLCSLVEDEIGARKIEHFNWGVVLTMDGENGVDLEIGLANIERVLLVGTNVKALAKQVKTARSDGIPLLVPDRMDPGWVWSGSSSSAVNVVAKRSFILERIGLHQNFLIPMWGADIARVFERSFPEFVSQDTYVQLDCASEADVRVAVGLRARDPEDLFSRCEPISEDEVDAQLRDVIRVLPHHVFSYVAMGNHPADVVEFALDERSIMDKDQRELLFAGLAELPGFSEYKQRDGTVSEFPGPFVTRLRELFRPGMGLAFFRKVRSGTSEDSAPGVACILRIGDRARLEQFIEEIDQGLKGPFAHYSDGPFDYWRISKKSFLDDPENNDPGFAVMGDYLVITNWVRLFPEAQEVMARSTPGMPLADLLEDRMRRLGNGARALAFVDVERLYAHMHQAKVGWVAERCKIEEMEKFHARQRLHTRWQQTRPGQPEEEWVDREFRSWMRKVRAERNPVVVERNINRNLSYFEDAFSHFFMEMDRDGPEFRFALSVATQENY